MLCLLLFLEGDKKRNGHPCTTNFVGALHTVSTVNFYLTYAMDNLLWAFMIICQLGKELHGSMPT